MMCAFQNTRHFQMGASGLRALGLRAEASSAARAHAADPDGHDDRDEPKGPLPVLREEPAAKAVEARGLRERVHRNPYEGKQSLPRERHRLLRFAARFIMPLAEQVVVRQPQVMPRRLQRLGRVRDRR